MAKIVVTKELPEDLMSKLKREHQVTLLPQNEDPSFEVELKEELKDAQGLITTKVRIDGPLLKEAPQLKIVSDLAVGYDNYDLEAMKTYKVLGSHTPGVLDETVADLTFGLILASARRLSELDQYIKNGEWRSKDDLPFYGTDVHHQTLGIVGMGRIGEQIAKRARLGFEMNVLYYNRTRKPEVEKALDVTYTSFEDLLTQSDFVVLLTPLTKETYHLFNKEAFQQMKPSSYFINVSRGQTVDERALIEALETGEIRGAGLDVFDQEPINPDNPLLKMKNVTLAPHIGSAVGKTRYDMAALGVENILAYFSGKTPPTLVKELKELFTK
jgi:glyoxylate/hydroxypyruvate/2-ketogluconate reductase